MRHGRLTSAIVVAALAGAAAGQSPSIGLPTKPKRVGPAKTSTQVATDAFVLPTTVVAAPATTGSAAPATDIVPPSGDNVRLAITPWVEEQATAGPNQWAEVEYLYWRMKHAPLPTPLVTTGNPTDVLPGALGQPGTRPLFGGSGIDYGAFSGARLNVGGWLNCEQTIGIEAGGLLFERRASYFAIRSDATGNPPIYLPVVNQNPTSINFGRQSSYTVADPLYPDPTGPTYGNVGIGTTTRLWGAELNGLVNLARGSFCSVDGIVGVRYLDLQESLRISGFSNDLFDDLQQTFNESFSTRNQFYGGQAGARLTYRCDNIFIAATGKVGIGCTRQVVDIQGNSFWGGTGFAPPPGFYQGGVYTQPSNIGHNSSNALSLVPQVGIKFGVNLTSCVSATVGYDLLYWSSVVQPGAQVDHNLNPTQFPGAGVVGALLPAPLFTRNDFLAHGLSFGFAFAY